MKDKDNPTTTKDFTPKLQPGQYYGVDSDVFHNENGDFDGAAKDFAMQRVARQREATKNNGPEAQPSRR